MCLPIYYLYLILLTTTSTLKFKVGKLRAEVAKPKNSHKPIENRDRLNRELINSYC